MGKADNSPPKLADADIQKYFEAIASADVDQIKSVLAIASPDSIAYAYAREQIDYNNASIDGGAAGDPSALKKIAKTYTFCADSADTKTCGTFSDFESKDGKLANFKVNGMKMDDRISLGNGGSKKAGSLATIKFLSSYRSAITGNVFVNMEVTSNKQAVHVGIFEATYRGTDKRQSTATTVTGNTELAADSTSTMSMIFKANGIGGVATFEVSIPPDYQPAVMVSLKTR